MQQLGKFDMDAFTADDGHNALISNYWSPSESFFEHCSTDHHMWLFPPMDMIQLVMQFLDEKRRLNVPLRYAILLPERADAPWFRYCEHYRRVTRYRKGSDLFRVRTDAGVWTKCPPSQVPWVVLAPNP